MTYTVNHFSPRVQHALLETHGSIAWIEDGTTASPRHPMKITVRLGAKSDGTLTAFHFRNVLAQAIGFALIENFHVDDNGVMVNPNLRNYRIPTYGGEYVSLPACSVANQPSSRLSRWTGTAANGKRAQLLPRTAWLATFSSVVRRKGRLCRVIGDRS